MTQAFVKAYLQRQVHHGEFELHSGVKTNYYIDIRPLFLDSLVAHDVALLMLMQLKQDVSVIAGIEKSGFIIIPSIVAICHHQHLKGVLIRKIPKNYGMCRMVEGDFIPEGSKIAIVDDIITTGASLMFATDAIQEKYKVDVVQWLVLVDRTEGLVKTPIPLTSIFSAEEILAG